MGQVTHPIMGDGCGSIDLPLDRSLIVMLVLRDAYLHSISKKIVYVCVCLLRVHDHRTGKLPGLVNIADHALSPSRDLR